MSDFDSPPLTDLTDLNFYKRPKKHGQKKGKDWPLVEPPELPIKFGVVDTHAHVNMLNNPGLALSQAKANNVSFIEAMTDPLGEEGVGFYDEVEKFADAPKIRVSCGVHPHYAKDYTPAIEDVLLEKLNDPLTNALGEVGLDYHYDFSPREDQIRVFERQIELANELNLPIILHVREAFDDAFSCMENGGWNERGVLLHCYTAGPAEIKRWVEAGCFVAFGGAFTFKKSVEIRKASHYVPLNRLLTETDAPFMAPEPFRNTECVPAHVLFSAQALFDELKDELNVEADEFFARLQKNAFELLKPER